MRRLLAVFLIALLLSGCAMIDPGLQTTAAATDAATVATTPESLYDPSHPLHSEAVKVYPLGRSNCIGVNSFGKDLLVLLEEGGTELLVFDAENGCLKHSLKLKCSITPNEAQLFVGENGLAYVDEVEQSVVLLDNHLRETDRVKLPDDLRGDVAVSDDLAMIYYCTDSQLRALEIKTGISRLLRQQEDILVSVDRLCFDGTVISYTARDNDREYTAFVDVKTGLLLGSGTDIAILDTSAEQYLLAHQDGRVTELLTGDLNGSVSRFCPADGNGEILPMLEHNAVATAVLQEQVLTIDYYEASSGIRTAATELDGLTELYGIAANAQSLWLVASDQNGTDVLIQWNTALTPTEEEASCYTIRFTAQNPDTQGLAACQAQADAIAQQYGVDIRIGSAALEVPCDYELVAEHQPEVYQTLLPFLEKALKQYPDEFFTKLSKVSDSRKIHICLVRQVAEGVSGVQYWHDGSAYMAITLDDELIHSFHSELYMVLDTFIFNNNSMLDEWHKLNPKKFSYTLDYEAAAAITDESLISGEKRAFIDYASMSYPREDRAAIFAWAMRPDAAECFQSETMQKKLVRLCESIRDAYRWEKDERTFPWEQYLEKPLAYTGKKK